MRFSNLAALLPLLASTQAWVIPEGAADGVYAVTRDADGNDVHTRLGSTESAVEVRDADQELERRSFGQIWCGCGFDINPANTDNAVAKLKGQLSGGNKIPAHQSFYSITNNVVAFACNRGNVAPAIDPNEYGRALEAITGSCGRYIAGAYELGGPVIVGYQRYKGGDDFCASSTSSSANHC